MIVRRNLKWSIIARNSWRQVLFFLGMGLVAAWVGRALGRELIPPSAVSALSAALAIFLAFRNSSAYDRWWEARKLWGALVNASRSFSRQVLSLLGALDSDPAAQAEAVSRLQQRLVYRQIAFAHALRLMLRQQQDAYSRELSPLLAPDELERVATSTNAPLLILQLQAEDVRQAARTGGLDVYRQLRLDETLSIFSDIQGGCERIKNTPLPRQYDYFPRLFLYLYSVLLPFSLVPHLGLATPLLSVPVSFVFLVLESIGRLNEAPFENRIQDVPLTALCRTIERNLRDLLQERELPPPAEPVDGFLW